MREPRNVIDPLVKAPEPERRIADEAMTGKYLTACVDAQIACTGTAWMRARRPAMQFCHRRVEIAETVLAPR